MRSLIVVPYAAVGAEAEGGEGGVAGGAEGGRGTGDGGRATGDGRGEEGQGVGGEGAEVFDAGDGGEAGDEAGVLLVELGGGVHEGIPFFTTKGTKGHEGQIITVIGTMRTTHLSVLYIQVKKPCF